MAKKIFEELPARKHAPAAAPAAKEGGERKGGGAEGSEKKIRQAVYDIRYRARREGIDLRAAYSQYMQNSNLTAPEQAAVRAKLFGKDGGGDKKESYNGLMTDSATGTVAKALFKVFVEGSQPVNEYQKQLEEGTERKYKVRVTDPKTEKSYVRYADRAKITELRQKGLKVEMTEHGEPYEGERKKKGKLDPVAKNPENRDGDVNNDGKKDKTDSYIYNRRDAINAAIAKKKEMQEEFLADATTSTEGQGTMVPDGGVNNYAGKRPVVKINPESEVDGHGLNRMRGLRLAHTELNGEVVAENAYSKFMTMLNEKAVSEQQQKLFGLALSVKRGQTPRSEVSDEVLKIVDKMSEEEIRKYAKTSHEGLPEKKEVKEEMGGTCEKCGKCPCECEDKDNRAARTYRELLKNKLRAMGMKNPIMLGAPDDEEKIMKIMTSPSAKMTAESSCGSSHTKKKKKKKGY